MTRTRMFRPFQPALASLVCTAFGGLVGGGCDSYPTLKEQQLDCTSAEAGYTFDMLDAAETVGQANWWISGDDTKKIGATVSVDVEAIEGEGRCGSKAATVFRSAHNDDWGSMYGYNNLGPVDKSQDDGISFWARAPGNTTKGFTLLLDDPNTVFSSTSYCVNNGGSNGTSGGTIYAMGPNGENVSTSGTASFSGYPESCGNSYAAVMLVKSSWAFYAVPFSTFQQTATPNRVPNEKLTHVGNVPGTALLTQTLMDMILRFPKEANAELWIDNLAFYRKK
jgi:hypothetical protein